MKPQGCPMSSDLKPCPFCGGEAEADADGVSEGSHDWQEIRVACLSCGARIEDERCACCHPNRWAEAIAAWNRRAGDATG